MYTDAHFTYNGYEYRTWLDIEEDNQKIFHECYRNGKRLKMSYEFYNHSPYSYMTREEFIDHCQNVEVFLG